MLRYASIRRFSSRVVTPGRNYATKNSAKRALSKEQLSGEKPKAEVTKSGSLGSGQSKGSDSVGKASSTTTPVSTDPSSGGGDFMLPVAVAITGAGAAWYFNLIPGFGREAESGSGKAKRSTADEKKNQTVERAVKPKVKVEPTKATEEEEKKTAKSELNKQVEGAKTEESTKKPAVPENIIPQTETSRSSKDAVLQGSSQVIPEASSIEATKELLSSRQEESSEVLRKAHQVLRASVDESLFSDLEKLTPAELRVRVVQLGTEMAERTKWEAVRLKEFMALKEKEVGEKYLDLMQKQRHEFEDLLALKIREQEDNLTRQTNSILQEKENGIQAIVAAAKESLEAEHQANLASSQELLEKQLDGKYELEYAKKLADEKQIFLAELEKKLFLIEELSKKLEDMESALNVSRSITAGSVEAHRISAASLALSEKLETSKAAKAEVATLKNVLKDNQVISSAVGSIPTSISVGVPTISELQTKFDTIYNKCRQAALVPSGWVGLEGQLFGILLSSLKYAPGVDEPAPEDKKDEAEYVLARARQYVHLGELKSAVEELKKLQGQSAFTIQDWKQSAEDRIVVDKALHVIKMEVALMNETMSKAGE